VPDAVTWAFNPWRANWRRPAAALAIELFFAFLGGFSFTWPDWWPAMLGWAFLGLLLLLGMTSTVFLPVRYRLDARGVTVFFLGVAGFRGWEHYRNFYPHDTGVHLTTMPQPSALDPFRGHFLRYAENKLEVDRYVQDHMTLRGQPEAR